MRRLAVLLVFWTLSCDVFADEAYLQHIRDISLPRSRSIDTEISPDGSLIVQANMDKQLHIVDLESGETKRNIPTQSPTKAIRFSPDSRFLAAQRCDGTQLEIWDLHSDAEPVILPSEGSVNSLVFSDDGRFIAGVAANGKAIYLWNLVEKQAISHPISINDVTEYSALAFSSEKQKFVSYQYRPCSKLAVGLLGLDGVYEQTDQEISSRSLFMLSADAQCLAYTNLNMEIHAMAPSGHDVILEGLRFNAMVGAVFTADKRLIWKQDCTYGVYANEPELWVFDCHTGVKVQSLKVGAGFELRLSKLGHLLFMDREEGIFRLYSTPQLRAAQRDKAKLAL